MTSVRRRCQWVWGFCSLWQVVDAAEVNQLEQQVRDGHNLSAQLGDNGLGLFPAGSSPIAQDDQAKADKPQGEWFVAPLVFSNPTLESGAVLVGGRIQSLYPDAKPSVAGIAAMASQNGSWFLGLGGKIYLPDNRWSFTAGLGTGEAHYDLDLPSVPGVGAIELPLVNHASIVSTNALRRLGDTFWSIGGRFSVTINETSYGGNLPANSRITEDDLTAQDTSGKVGLQVDYDSTDDGMSKQRGVFSRVVVDVYRTSADEFYEKAEAEVNVYLPWRENHVLALRASSQGSFGEVPFYALSYLGQGADLRGYRYGSHFARHLVAIQGEERWSVSQRWSIVGFAGLARLGSDLEEMSKAETYSNIGGGLRFAIAPANRLFMRLDMAHTDDDNVAIILAIGEAY